MPHLRTVLLALLFLLNAHSGFPLGTIKALKDGKPYTVIGVDKGRPIIEVGNENHIVDRDVKYAFSKSKLSVRHTFFELRNLKAKTEKADNIGEFTTTLSGQIRLNLKAENCWMFLAFTRRDKSEYHALVALGHLDGGKWIEFNHIINHTEKLKPTIPHTFIRSTDREIRRRATNDTERATLKIPVLGEKRSKQDSRPRILKLEKPKGSDLFTNNITFGSAVVRFDVHEDDTPSNFKIVRATSQAFADAAIEALKKSKFLAATRDGNPVRSTAMKTFHFEK